MANELTATVHLDLTGRTLRAMLDPVLAHAAGPGSVLPLLEYVEIMVTGGVLYLAATDRYTLGVIRHPIPDYTGPDLRPLAIAADSLRRVMRTFKPRESIGMDITPGAVGAVTLWRFETPIEYRIPGADVTCVNWRKLLADSLTQEPQRCDLPVNPAYLARFRTVVREGQPLQLRNFGRIVVVACGEHFIGAVCPVRVSDSAADPFTAWHTDLTPAPAAKAA